MQVSEAAQLLLWAQGVDGRVLSELSARTWHQLIGHLPFDVALEAVQEHYREEHRWVMPADVLKRAVPAGPRYGYDATAEMLAEQKAAWCEAHGVTVEEFDEHKHDAEWIEEVSRRG
ncbi:hypothetical protein [Curtobacterium sp. Curtsp57]|uniref:hypothetical protein n=1 Tax=Curtobacterium sp. Curtsp57 TaxID=3243047 RepID=UPI0039B4859E